MTLAETQRTMARWLADGSTDAASLVGEHGRRGLAVYEHAYTATLVAALRDAFEKTHAWLGDEGFDAAARAHIAARPPSSWTLADYGAGFADTLVRLHPDDREVAELATLDWSLRRAFDGPDAAPLDPATLAEVDWDDAVLDLVPTATMAPVTTNVATIWRAIADGETPPAAQPLPVIGGLLVWRDGLEPRFRTIDLVEASAIARVRAGDDFAAVCAGIAAMDQETPAEERAGAMLGQWIAEGLVCGVRG